VIGVIVNIFSMNRKSFTIVEIMVVMAVIGIIMTLSIVGIQAAQKQQRVTTITNDMNQFKLALASYYSEYRQYPACLDEIAFDSVNNEICLYEPNLNTPHYDCSSTVGKASSIKLSQPGMVKNQADLQVPYTPCSLAEATAQGLPDQSIVIPSSEQWVLDYRVNIPTEGCNIRSQNYKIRYCDESGPTELLSQ